MQEEWAIGRQVAYWIMQPHLKKNSTLKPTDLMRLGIDNKKKGKKKVRLARITKIGDK